MSGVQYVNVIATVKIMGYVIHIQVNVHVNQVGLASTVNYLAEMGHTAYSVVESANVRMEVFVIRLTEHVHVLKTGLEQGKSLI